MHPILTVAIQAARQAGNFIARSYEKPDPIKIIGKIKNNFVTNIGKKTEQIIIEIIRKFYPSHAILTEEDAQRASSKNTIQWIIDPLNGISNFTKRLPHFSISISVRINCHTEVAVIYNPMLNELFTSVRGQGAQLNGYRLRLKNNNELEGAIVATGSSFKEEEYSSTYVNIFAKLLKKCADFRRTGSSALDLAYVATGRIDALFEMGIKPWDFMAGELLVREAGGIITDFAGNYNYPYSGNLLAGNARMVKKIATEIQAVLGNLLKS